MRLAVLFAVLCSCAPMIGNPGIQAQITGSPVAWVNAPEPPDRAAVRIWEQFHGEATAACQSKARDIKVVVVSQKGLDECCGPNRKIAACTLPDLSGICLVDTPYGQSYSIRMHEYLHVLNICSGSNEGVRHSDVVWQYVPMAEIPPESPWYRAPAAK